MREITPKKRERIVAMLLAGHSLDYISEEGMVYGGWTREQAQAVVDDRGWALDWTGRLMPRYLPSAVREEVSEHTDLDRLLAVGLDHSDGNIRRMATRVDRAVDELRRAIIRQEADDREAADRRKRERALRDAELSDPDQIPHGEWAGFLRHKRLGLPMDGCGCEEAGRRRTQKAVEASLAVRRKRPMQAAS